jgi:4-hydroxy-tetrahydrodipicolinate reductase
MTSGTDRSDDLTVALFGASGRMGRALVQSAEGLDDVRIVGACAGRGSVAIGQDLGSLSRIGKSGVFITEDPAKALQGARVAIDFSLPIATPVYASACREAGCALVCGVTGLDQTAHDALVSAAQEIPVLYGANLSVGMAVLERLVRLAAGGLDGGFDAEIIEAHHNAKRDAPSGTALRLGEVIAGERGQALDDLRAPVRRAGPRNSGEIGFAVVRAGDIAGEHTVLFAGQGERLELTHRAGTREAFAAGALRAARWLATPDRRPGLYNMHDVLRR